MTSDQSDTIQSTCDEFNRAIREILMEPRARFGWKRCKLDSRQREYIIQREQLLRAIKDIQNIEPQFYSIGKMETTLKLRENVLHAMAAMAQAMAAIEGGILSGDM